jgi:hypothetical protein
MFGTLQLLLRVDPATGLLRDYSPFAHPIELSGGVAVSGAQQHFGLDTALFDPGVAARISVPSSYPEFMTQDFFTVEAWVYRTSSAPNSARIVQFTEGDKYSPLYLGMDDGGSLVAYGTRVENGWTASIPNGGAIPLNQWCHVAAVRANSVLELYLNGIKTGSTAYVGRGVYQGAVKLAIGGQAAGVVRTFPGHIAEVRITALDAKYSANFAPPTGLLLAENNFLGIRSVPDAYAAVSLTPAIGQAQPVGARSAGLAIDRKNIYQGGSGEISGTTTLNNVVYPRKQVRLFNKRSALLVAETWSDGAGAYTFSNIDATQEYFVVSFDETGAQEAVAKDRVRP